MEATDILITVASWEERFQLGFQRLTERCPSKVVIFSYQEYMHLTKDNLTWAKNCSRDAELIMPTLSFGDPVNSWKTINETLTKSFVSAKNVLVDISTMPRESIWIIFDILEQFSSSISYAYHQPVDYSKEWLSRDPKKPRLVFKLGGISKLGAQTKLLVLTGYDVDRVKQMISFFEPAMSFIGIQTGTQFGNEKQNIDMHTTAFGNESRSTIFSLDAYADDHGLKSIEEQIMPHVNESNVIMTSLGPKLSAVALYQLHKKYPITGLAYAPSGEYNPDYSHGIGMTIYGKL